MTEWQMKFVVTGSVVVSVETYAITSLQSMLLMKVFYIGRVL